MGVSDILFNWEACMKCKSINKKRQIPWSPLLPRMLKFNVNGAGRGKEGSVGIGGVLQIARVSCFLCFPSM